MATILLIDDDEDVLATLRRVLESAKHDVVTARHGAEGLRRVAAQAFDLVVTDIVMPEQEGIETIIRLKELDPRLPVLAISGGGSTGNEFYLKLAQNFGAAAIIAKPFMPREFLDRVAELLGD